MAMSEKTVVDRKSGQKYTIVGESPKGCLKYYTCNPSVDTPLIRAIKSMMGDDNGKFDIAMNMYNMYSSMMFS